MSSVLDAFLPEGLSTLAAVVLLVSSFFTSAVSAGLGLGGGVALLALMTQVMPVSVVIPVHGVVQLGSNASRVIVQFSNARFHLLTYFLVGSVIGAVIGGRVFVSVPESVITVLIALFILWSAWGSLPPLRTSGNGLLFFGGIFATVLTMFVGATGPFVMAIMRRFDLQRLELISTHALAMALQHTLKVIVFGALGFAFGEWLPFMLAMIAIGFFGTVAGTHLLRNMPEKTFRIALKAVMTLIAIELLLEEAYGLLG